VRNISVSYIYFDFQTPCREHRYGAQYGIVKILAVSDEVVERLYNLCSGGHFNDIGLILGCGDLPYPYLENLVGRQIPDNIHQRFPGSQVLVPAFLFPPWLQKIGFLIPTRWAVDGLDAMTWRGSGFGVAALDAAALLGFGLVFATVAMRRFRFEAE